MINIQTCEDKKLFVYNMLLLIELDYWYLVYNTLQKILQVKNVPVENGSFLIFETI